MRNILFFLLYVLLNPRLIPLIFKSIYVPVYVQFEWLKKFNIRTVVDVGANRGDVTRALHFLFPKATIFAFEPIKDEAEKIKNLHSPKVVVENLALANKTAQATLYRYSFSPSSSLLPVSSGYKKKFKGVATSKKVNVQVITLDDYFKNKKVEGDVFLKIDTQGTEKQVLEGAQRFLSKVSVVHIEIPIEELYQKQNSFDEVYDFLTKKGFEYKGIITESYFYPNFSLREAENCVFVKK